MKLKILTWTMVILAAAATAAAQQGTTEVRGTVVDAQGAVLPGVTVTIRNQMPIQRAIRSSSPFATVVDFDAPSRSPAGQNPA